MSNLFEKYGIRPKKGLGQNFLTNREITKRIALSGAEGSPYGILEIGPGAGALTRELSPLCSKVVCVEIDASLIPLLDESLSDYPNITIVHGDIMKLDIREFVRGHFGYESVSVCANLPYYITTPVITTLLECGRLFKGITIMLQKEVADRLNAKAGTESYGAISLFVQYHAEVKKLFDVAPGNFYPPPKVKSSVIRLTPLETPPVAADKELLFRVIRAAFGQRRKTLVNALFSEFVGVDKAGIAGIISEVTKNADIRGEELGICTFAEISELLGGLIYEREQ